MISIRKLKKLVKICKKNNRLDAKSIKKVANFLTREELKQFLFLLKRERASEQVLIETPMQLSIQVLSQLKKLFKEKALTTIINKDLIAGMRIHMLDAILDLSLAGRLRKIEETL